MYSVMSKGVLWTNVGDVPSCSEKTFIDQLPYSVQGNEPFSKKLLYAPDTAKYSTGLSFISPNNPPRQVLLISHFTDETSEHRAQCGLFLFVFKHIS